jgi:glutaredoxin
MALLGLLAAASFGAAAQVYRIVGPDGKVTFSDRPPPDAKADAAGGGGSAAPAGGGGSPLSALPFDLRNTASKYPVTLYTGPDCGPCGTGRSFLQGRGIPFTERTVTSDEDVEALKRLAGAARLPFLTIGGQQLRGFSDAEWGSFLDAAGYPKTSQLPAGYRQAAPAPLVAATERKDPAAGAAAGGQAQAGQPQRRQPPAAAAAAAPSEAPPPNPAGIRF